MPDDGALALDQLPKAPGLKIIRAAQEQAWRDGFQFLAEVERVHAMERARGYADGRVAGAKEASALVLQTAAKVDQYLASVEPELGQLAFDIVRKVLGVFDDAELVARSARNALAEFRQLKAVTLRIHPSAETYLRVALADLLAGADDAPMITLEADPRLDTRSCVLATESAVVEASIETQLEAIAEAMKRIDRGLKA